ncbi:MAG: hypothetical protein WCP70_02665 [Methanothrix sp.]
MNLQRQFAWEICVMEKAGCVLRLAAAIQTVTQPAIRQASFAEPAIVARTTGDCGRSELAEKCGLFPAAR